MPSLKNIWLALAEISLSAPALAGHHGGTKDIVDTAAEAATFKTLIAAAKAAGLAEVLKGDGPLTAFAQTTGRSWDLADGTVWMIETQPVADVVAPQ